jgi:hypothetical protein
MYWAYFAFKMTQIKKTNSIMDLIDPYSYKEGLTDIESDCQIRSSVLRSNRLVRPQGFEPRTF